MQYALIFYDLQLILAYMPPPCVLTGLGLLTSLLGGRGCVEAQALAGGCITASARRCHPEARVR